MPQSSKPQETSRQTGQDQADGGRKQPQQQAPDNSLLGPAGDPAEGKRDIGPKVKR